MRVRTMKDISAAIRARRKTLGLGQAELAKQAGVSREWIIDIEKGKPRAEAALLLRTLDVLGIAVTLDLEPEGRMPGGLSLPRKPRGVSIDDILERARERKR